MWIRDQLLFFGILLDASDPSKGRDGWTLSEGFVAEEAKAILPHRVTGR